MTTLCHLDRSAAQWRDLRFYSPAIWLRTMTTLPLVIPTGAQRSGGTCDFYSPAIWLRIIRPYPLSSRPERSVVERSLCGYSFLEMFFLVLQRCLAPEYFSHFNEPRV